MFYYIIFIILSVIALLEMVIMPWKHKKWIYISIMAFFVVLGSLRWETGNDWGPYYRFFTSYDADDPFFMAAMEPGFSVLVRILRLFSNNFTFYLVVLSVLVISLKAVVFYRYTNALLLAALLYWGSNMGDIIAVRQMLAISICLLSTIYIVEEKPAYFVLIVLLASQIHITSIVFLSAYKIYHLNWGVPSKYVWICIAIALGLIGGSESVLHAGINLVPSGLGLDRVTQKAEMYLIIGNEKNYGNNLSKDQRMIAAIAKRAILLPIFFLFQRNLSNASPYYKGFLNLYTAGNIIYFITMDFLTLQRIASYFYIFEILLFCIIFENVKSRSLWLLGIIAYALSKLVSLVVNGADLLVPYIWIFSEDTKRYIQ